MSHIQTKALKINSATSLYSKSLLIAIAALALSATGTQAFSGDALMRAGLTDSQVAAFEVARELREEGDAQAARDVLVGAGIDETVIERVRSVLSKNQDSHHVAMMVAVRDGDYQGFITVIDGTPLADIVTSQADFERFKTAHDLKTGGDSADAADIFADLGLVGHGNSVESYEEYENGDNDDDLTDSQKEALSVARAANDHEAVQAIIDDMGIFKGAKRDQVKFLRDGRQMQ